MSRRQEEVNMPVVITHMSTDAKVKKVFKFMSELEAIILDACRSSRQGNPSRSEVDRAAVYAKRVRDGEDVKTGGYSFIREGLPQ